MPYNNTPITPTQEVTGQVALPLARVQKIINADQERLHTSKNAAFAIALATEMFIQHLATTTHNVVKTERKPRRNIQYRDVATAVAKTDNLEFLVDVVPKTTTYKEFKKKQADKEAAVSKGKAVNGSGGQTTLGGGSGGEMGVDEDTPEAMDVDEDVAEEQEEDEDEEEERASSEPSEDMAAKQIEMEMRGPRTNGSSPAVRRPSGFTAINGTK
ncbi:hypothetical protein K504DRAFT_433941 [Pleomassaria siparia CBS 279.74]|uniref:Transcription factor CBF/NF-Y/archaeal histone domain-containing protein n=1 Tax=Pleomassaria siparia CBS 279.74 TaxID=1314801 RepID=A0A6G1K8F0_9PLEO|nr:hypothetical protein K504DRAFT_433941 [Pleomassaria siparia CBS 279.74]